MTNHLKDGTDLRRTAAVAADYEQLQGLITATTGGGLVLLALGSSTWAAITCALGVAVWTSYYQARFGRAVSRRSAARSIVSVLAALIVCIAGFVVDGLLSWPVLLLPLAAALCLLLLFRSGYRHVGVGPVHWVALGLVVLSAFAPLAGLAVLGARTGMLSLGLGMLLIGVADHVRLVRSMKPVPRD